MWKKFEKMLSDFLFIWGKKNNKGIVQCIYCLMFIYRKDMRYIYMNDKKKTLNSIEKLISLQRKMNNLIEMQISSYSLA